MDMLELTSDTLFGMSSIAASDHQISSCTDIDLAGNMTRKNKLSIVPFDIHLITGVGLLLALTEFSSYRDLTRLFCMYKSCFRTCS
jgi:hypothetical protein